MFSRVNPFSWAVGDKLTSAQQNALDIDHANALDKTVAGDNISGTVNIIGLGGIVAGVSGAITSPITNGINSGAAGGISSNVVGGISLTGGPTDWVTVSPPRTRAFAQALSFTFVSTGWTATTAAGVICLLGPGPGSAGTIQYLQLPITHNGATLSSVDMFLQVIGPHTNVPSTLPAMRIRRIDITTYASVILSTTPTQTFSPAPVSGTAWDNGSLVQSWNYSCNQNNVINNAQYLYSVELTDELGANSVAGNRYAGMRLNFTAINDTRFST